MYGAWLMSFNMLLGALGGLRPLESGLKVSPFRGGRKGNRGGDRNEGIGVRGEE